MDPELQRIIDKGIAAGLSDDDIRGLAVEHASRKQAPVQPMASHAQETGRPKGLTEDQWAAMTSDHARMNSVAAQETASLIVPGILKAASYAGPAISGAVSKGASLLQNPYVGGTVGAAYGGYQGGIPGAVAGAVSGVAGSSALQRGASKLAGSRMTQGMSAAAKAPPLDANALMEEAIQSGLAKGTAATPVPPQTVPAPTQQPPVVSRVHTPADYASDIAHMKARGQEIPPELARLAQSVPAPTAASAKALEQEILSRIAREKIKNVDWDKDVVSRTARSVKGLRNPGESRIGIADQAAELAKTVEKELPAGAPKSLQDLLQLLKDARQLKRVNDSYK